MNLNKDILWVFSHSNPPSIPSYVFSGILPADYLNIQKVIFLKDHNPREMLTEENMFVFTDSTIQISGNTLNTSEALHAVDPAKIYLCDIVTDRVYFEKTDYYNHDFFDFFLELSSPRSTSGQKGSLPSL